MTSNGGFNSVLVTRDYSPQYHDPIDVPSGALVDVVGPDDENGDWWWCRAEDGRAGWVRGDLLEPEPTRGGTARLRRAYTARELEARRGERLDVVHEYAGWVFAQNRAGVRGWVPVTHVVEESRGTR